MLRNQRARALMVALGLALALVVVGALVTRGGAVTVQQAPYGSAFTVNPGTTYNMAVLLRTPVTIVISDSGSGSYATGHITACCDGVSWSWVGLHGSGALARGGNAKTVGTVMCTAYTNQYVRLLSPTAGTVQFWNASSYPVRVFVQW